MANSQKANATQPFSFTKQNVRMMSRKNEQAYPISQFWLDTLAVTETRCTKQSAVCLSKIPSTTFPLGMSGISCRTLADPAVQKTCWHRHIAIKAFYYKKSIAFHVHVMRRSHQGPSCKTMKIEARVKVLDLENWMWKRTCYDTHTQCVETTIKVKLVYPPAKLTKYEFVHKE